LKKAMCLFAFELAMVGSSADSALACPVATTAVAIPATVAPALSLPNGPVVVEQTPAVVQSVPVLAAVPAPAVAVLATPTVVTEIVKVKARRSAPRRIRLLVR
jgi:hypothetical protein